MSLSIFLELTNACNLRCRHCLPASGHAREGELTTAELRALLTALSKEHGAHRLFLTGGEPTIREDFCEIVRHATGNGYRLELVTNGTTLIGDVIQALKAGAAKIHVSLDGATAAVHEQLRGRGTFARALDGIRLLRDSNIEFDIAMTVTRENFAQVREAAQLARELGAKGLSLSEITRGGRANDHWSMLELLDWQRAELPDIIDIIARTVFDGQAVGQDTSCWVDGSSLYISANGRAYPCSEVFNRAPEMTLGEVRSPRALADVLQQLGDTARIAKGKRCCYVWHGNSQVSLMRNVTEPCVVAHGPFELIQLEGTSVRRRRA